MPFTSFVIFAEMRTGSNFLEAHVLDDPECAKVILTRNPLDSYVSLKIAAQTGQWKLTDAKQRREAKVRFEPQDFLQQLEENVPGFYTAATAPLLYIPLGSGPNSTVLNWLAALDDVTPDALPTGLNQNALRQWKKANPSHRSFAVLRHPVARAHHAFCTHILPNTDDRFHDIRRALSGKYKVDVPLNGDLSNYTIDDHKDAFLQFLKFLKANLAGQTSIRVDPAWATQTAQLEGAAQVVVPDMVIREEDAQAQLSHLAQSLGLKSATFPTGQGGTPYDLAAIYDSRLEKLCAQAYRKDYINFGFSDWSES